MTNLYEEGKFGGIPSNLIVTRIRTGETDRQDTTIFTCKLFVGFATIDNKQEIPIRIESSRTLYIDERRINEEVTDECLHTILKKYISEYFTETYNYRFGFYDFYISGREIEDLKEEVSSLISNFSYDDYMRMNHYKRLNDKISKFNILEERDIKLKELAEQLNIILFPISKFSKEQERYSKAIADYQEQEGNIDKQIEELKKQICLLEFKKVVLKSRKNEYEELLEESKSYEAYCKKNGEIEEEEIEFGYIIQHDVKQKRLVNRTNQQACIEEFAKEQEKIRQEQENKAQNEETTSQKDILDERFSFFIREGILKPTNMNQYILCHNYTDKDFYYVYNLALNKGLTDPIEYKLMREHIIRGNGKGAYPSPTAFERGNPENFKRWLPNCLM